MEPGIDRRLPSSGELDLTIDHLQYSSLTISIQRHSWGQESRQTPQVSRQLHFNPTYSLRLQRTLCDPRIAHNKHKQPSTTATLPFLRSPSLDTRCPAKLRRAMRPQLLPPPMLSSSTHLCLELPPLVESGIMHFFEDGLWISFIVQMAEDPRMQWTRLSTSC